MRILLSTTSFQDTPGAHHELLAASGLDVVVARGPLPEKALLSLVAGEGFDGLLCGDDAITAAVIDAARPRLKVVSKYGIGLDSIDVAHATACKIPVMFTPGVNHTTVAEHTIGLMIALAKQFWVHLRATKAGQWTRLTGSELSGKRLSVLGVGRIGREVLRRAAAFDMLLTGYDQHWDEVFAERHAVRRAASPEEALAEADVVSLHMNLDATTRHFINPPRLLLLRPGALLINTARGGLVDENAVADACRRGSLGGYATDVMDKEPPPPDHVFNSIDNIIVTPHVGSRTRESVERQGLRAVRNLINFLGGDDDYVQANPW